MKFEALNEKGLTRSYKVVVAAKDIEERINAELEGLKTKVNLKGFRPGHAPVSLLKKQHGQAVRGQVVEKLVNSAADKVVKDKKIKPADTPTVDLISFDEGADLEFKLDIHVLPDIKLPDLSKIKLERLVAKGDDAALGKVMDGLLAQQKLFEDAPKTKAAKSGDAVVIDFLGKIGGIPFEGAEAEDFQLELGSGAFIEGFEKQLIGAKEGDARVVKVTFPENYNMEGVAGKDAEFDVTVKKVRTRRESKADDEFAKSLGFGSLKELHSSIRAKIDEDHANLSHSIIKRKLLDVLAEENVFDVPPGMIDREYAEIWRTIREDMVSSGELSAEEAKKMTGPEDQADRDDFRNIAERRVRLGLLLAEIGRENNVLVTPEEINQQILFEAKRFPGQEQQVFDYYKENPEAVQGARAPVYEEKVVKLILSKAVVAEKSVSGEALSKAYQEMEAEDAGEAEEKKPAKKPAKKAAPAKKPAKKAAAKKPAAKKPAAKKKTPAKKK